MILTNVGNPQALGQQPITFFRQVMALLVAPFLEDDPAIAARMPPDVRQRAAAYRAMLAGGSVGAYTDSRGVPGIRKEVAAFIHERDGCPVLEVGLRLWWRQLSEAVVFAAARTLSCALKPSVQRKRVPASVFGGDSAYSQDIATHVHPRDSFDVL